MLKLNAVVSYVVVPNAPTEQAPQAKEPASQKNTDIAAKRVGPAAKVSLSSAARAALETPDAVKDKARDVGIGIELGGPKIKDEASAQVINDDLIGL